MTPKTLFTIVIKIIGLLFLVNIVQVIIPFLSILTEIYYRGDILPGGKTAEFVVSIIIVGFYFLVINYTLFNTEVVVEKLRLDDNFDEEKIDLRIDNSVAIKIATMIIGGITLVNNFIPLLLNIYTIVKVRSNVVDGLIDITLQDLNLGYMDLVRGVIMTLIGWFMVTNPGTIISFIERRRKPEKVID